MFQAITVETMANQEKSQNSLMEGSEPVNHPSDPEFKPDSTDEDEMSPERRMELIREGSPNLDQLEQELADLRDEQKHSEDNC
jgi:hypothetical protein